MKKTILLILCFLLFLETQAQSSSDIEYYEKHKIKVDIDTLKSITLNTYNSKNETVKVPINDVLLNNKKIGFELYFTKDVMGKGFFNFEEKYTKNNAIFLSYGAGSFYFDFFKNEITTLPFAFFWNKNGRDKNSINASIENLTTSFLYPQFPKKSFISPPGFIEDSIMTTYWESGKDLAVSTYKLIFDSVSIGNNKKIYTYTGKLIELSTNKQKIIDNKRLRNGSINIDNQGFEMMKNSINNLNFTNQDWSSLSTNQIVNDVGVLIGIGLSFIPDEFYELRRTAIDKDKSLFFATYISTDQKYEDKYGNLIFVSKITDKKKLIVNTNSYLTVLKGHKKRISDIGLSPNSRYLVSTSQSTSTIRPISMSKNLETIVWDLKNGIYFVIDSNITPIAFYPKFNLLISFDFNKKQLINTDLESGKSYESRYNLNKFIPNQITFNDSLDKIIIYSGILETINGITGFTESKISVLDFNEVFDLSFLKLKEISTLTTNLNIKVPQHLLNTFTIQKTALENSIVKINPKGEFEKTEDYNAKMSGIKLTNIKKIQDAWEKTELTKRTSELEFKKELKLISYNPDTEFYSAEMEGFQIKIRINPEKAQQLKTLYTKDLSLLFNKVTTDGLSIYKDFKIYNNKTTEIFPCIMTNTVESMFNVFN